MATSKTGRKHHRSPNYPAVSLPVALDRVEKIYRMDGRAGSPVEVAVRHLGYKSPHGLAMTVVSALQKYGLTENRGRRIVPTNRAIDLMEFSHGQKRFDDAVREAALQPAAFREVYDKYKGMGSLPSDESLRPELVTDSGFSQKAANGFLVNLRESFQFAGLLDGSNLISVDGNESINDVQSRQTTAESAPIARRTAPSHNSVRTAQRSKEFPLYLSGGQTGLLRVPSTMTEKDFELLKTQISACLSVTEATTTFVDVAEINALLVRDVDDLPCYP